MPLADLPRIGQGADLAQINDYLIMLGRRLNDFLNHLDTLNVEELDATVIIAKTITAAMINVTQLSAIAADLGVINAGSITTNAQINIGTDATVGKNLYLGTTTSDSKLVLNSGATIETNYGAGSISMKSSNQVSLTSLGNVTMQASGNVIVVSAGGTVSDLVGAINYLMSQVPSGFTGSQSVITSVNFGTSTTTSKTLNFTNGVLTSIT